MPITINPDSSNSVPVALMWSSLNVCADNGLPAASTTLSPGQWNVQVPCAASHGLTTGSWLRLNTAMMTR